MLRQACGVYGAPVPLLIVELIPRLLRTIFQRRLRMFASLEGSFVEAVYVDFKLPLMTFCCC